MKRKIYQSFILIALIGAVTLSVTLNPSLAFWTGTGGSFSNDSTSKGLFGIGSWTQESTENILIEIPVIVPTNPAQKSELINEGYVYPGNYDTNTTWYIIGKGYIFSRIVNGVKRYYSTVYDMTFEDLSNQYDMQRFDYLNFQIEYEQYARLEGNRIYVYNGDVFLRTTSSLGWNAVPDKTNPWQGYTYYSEEQLKYSSTKVYALYEPVRYDGKLYQVVDATLANKNLPTAANAGWKQVDDPQWKASNTYLLSDTVLVGEKIYRVIDVTKANKNQPGVVDSGWKRIDSIYWVQYNSYDQNEVVIHLGQYYKSKMNKNNSEVSDTNAWEKINYRVWDPNVVYQLGDVIYYNRKKYTSLSNNNTSALTDTTKWSVNG